MKLENKLKEKLLYKKKVLGCWTSIDNEITSEILALVGFDFLLIDTSLRNGADFEFYRNYNKLEFED